MGADMGVSIVRVGRWIRFVLSIALVIGWIAAGPAEAARPRTSEPVGFQLFESPQVNPLALNEAGTRLYVANTTGNSIDVFDTFNHFPVGIIEVTVERDPG